MTRHSHTASQMAAAMVLALVVLVAGGRAAAADPAPSVSCMGERLLIEVRGMPVGRLLEIMERRCGIRILGLHAVPERTVTHRQEGPRETVIRGLLQKLAVTSYALEYRQEMLVQVTVLPETGAPTDRIAESDAPLPEPDDVDAPRVAEALQIIDIIDGSQAAAADLRNNDILLSYDGIRVIRPADLVRLTRERTAQEPVELLVIRDGTPIRVYLNGGFIGIRIRQGVVDRDLLDTYVRPSP